MQYEAVIRGKCNIEIQEGKDGVIYRKELMNSCLFLSVLSNNFSNDMDKGIGAASVNLQVTPSWVRVWRAGKAFSPSTAP